LSQNDPNKATTYDRNLQPVNSHFNLKLGPQVKEHHITQDKIRNVDHPTKEPELENSIFYELLNPNQMIKNKHAELAGKLFGELIQRAEWLSPAGSLLVNLIGHLFRATGELADAEQRIVITNGGNLYSMICKQGTNLVMVSIPVDPSQYLEKINFKVGDFQNFC